ncbi:MAG: hypothetical protein ACXVB9_19655 [Bdellovibrionota bacterium]
MKNITIFCILALSTATAFAKPRSLESSVRSTVHDALPGTPPRQAQTINYPVPGTAILSATQYCGDGDVSNFAAAHPNWDHQEGGNIHFVVAYWLQGSGDADYPSPGLNGYYSAGNGTMTIGGASVTKMTPSVTASSPGDVSILGNLNSTVGRLTNLAPKAYQMPSASPAQEQFNLFTGIMMCKNVINPAQVAHDPNKVSMTMADLKVTLLSKVTTELASASDWNSLSGALKVKFTSAQDSINAQIGHSGSASLGSDTLSSLAQAIYSFPNPKIDPKSTDPLGDFTTALNQAPFKAQLNALAADLAGKATCVEVNGVDPTKKFAWEPFPMQLTCGALNANAGLQAAANAFFSPTAVPASDSLFAQSKQAILVPIIAGALMQIAQLDYNSSGDPLPKQTCIQGSPYIEKVMGSAVFPARPAPAQIIMTHPEPNFAISGFTSYYGNDHHTVFNMTSPAADDSYAAQLIRGASASTAPAVNLPASIVMGFNVRGVGCGTNVYCWNDRH